jgi:hypothetical protein
MHLQAATLEFLEPAARCHYLPGMRWLLAFSLAIVVAGPARAGELPPYEALVAQFEEVAFWDGRIRKHSSSIEVAVYSDKTQSKYYLTGLATVLLQAQNAAGVSFHRQPDPDKATLAIVFTPREKIQSLLRNNGVSTWREYRCLAIVDDHTAGLLNHASSWISDDEEPEKTRDCIVQEVVHAFGFTDGACHYKPSSFCETDNVFPIPPGDLALLKTLYDPRIKPNMTRAEAMPIARVILREIVSRPGG